MDELTERFEKGKENSNADKITAKIGYTEADIIGDYMFYLCVESRFLPKYDGLSNKIIDAGLEFAQKNFPGMFNIEDIDGILFFDLENIKKMISNRPEIQKKIEYKENNCDVFFDLSKLPPRHFIKEYVDCGCELQDSYPEFHMINAMTLLSYVPAKSIPAFGIEWNNTWFIGLGNAAVSGKSSAEKYLKEIMREIEKELPGYYTRLPQKPTPEFYIDYLAPNPKQIWIIDEASMFLKNIQRTYGSEMIENILTTYSHGTLSRGKVAKKDKNGVVISGGIIRVDDPHVPILWYSTPEYFSENVTSDLFSNGFLQRPMYILSLRKKDIKKDRQRTREDYQNIEKITQHMVLLINLTKNKKLVFNENQILNDWKYEQRLKLPELKNDIKRGARTRNFEHMRKLAIILTLGSREFMDIISTQEEIDPGNITDFRANNNVNIPDWAARLAIEWTELFSINFDRVYKIMITDNNGLLQKLKQKLLNSDTDWVKRTELMNTIRKYGKQFDEIIIEYIDNGEVQAGVYTNSKGKEVPIYKWVG